jgi:hypothetical protein
MAENEYDEDFTVETINDRSPQVNVDVDWQDYDDATEFRFATESGARIEVTIPHDAGSLEIRALVDSLPQAFQAALEAYAAATYDEEDED